MSNYTYGPLFPNRKTPNSPGSPIFRRTSRFAPPDEPPPAYPPSHSLSFIQRKKNFITGALPFRGNESTFLCFLGGIPCVTKSKVEHTLIVNMQKMGIHFHSFQFQFKILSRSLFAQLANFPFLFKALSIYILEIFQGRLPIFLSSLKEFMSNYFCQFPFMVGIKIFHFGYYFIFY